MRTRVQPTADFDVRRQGRINMDTNGQKLVACGDAGEVSDCSDCGESTAGTAIRDLASGFQMEISDSMEKFMSDTESVTLQDSGSNSQGKDLGPVEPQDVQLQKAELIMQIQYLMMFITNKLHEHQMMDKLDPKPCAQ